MQVTTVGLDLAKNIFHVHGVAGDGEVSSNMPVRRVPVLAFFQRLEPCLVGIKTCVASHYWVRELSVLGYRVRLMHPMYVKPYVKRGKSDVVDAEAICETVTRPTVRFVRIKSAEQQALLSLRRAWDFVVRQRTQPFNMLRSPAAEWTSTNFNHQPPRSSFASPTSVNYASQSKEDQTLNRVNVNLRTHGRESRQ